MLLQVIIIILYSLAAHDPKLKNDYLRYYYTVKMQTSLGYYEFT